MPRLPCPAHLLLSALLITLLWGSIVEARILPAKIPPGWKNSSAAASGTGLSPNIVGGTVVASQSTYPFQAMLEEAVNGVYSFGAVAIRSL